MDPEVTSKISRVRAWLLIVIGSLLSVGIAVIAAVLRSTINNDQSGGNHWTGTHEFTVRVFELFAAVFAFGLVALAGGIFQLRRGRPSWPAMIILLALVVVMFVLGKQIVGG